MRIVWSEAHAQNIANNLRRIHEQMEESLQQARTARSTIDEANPGGGNSRLNAIIEEYERLVSQLRRTEEEVESLIKGTQNMIDAFEDAEREAVSIMESLETGVASDGVIGGGAGMSAVAMVPDQSDRLINVPIELPKPIIGLHMEIGPFGLAPAWLIDSMNRYYVSNGKV